MILEGLHPGKIAARLGDASNSGRAKVSQDLRALRPRWRETADRDFAEFKGRQTVELEHLKAQLWAHLERPTVLPDGSPGPTLRDTRVAGRLLACIAQLSELQGLTTRSPLDTTTAPPLLRFREADEAGVSVEDEQTG
jgi:hypothetical protein